jgi:hypothetical protein
VANACRNAAFAVPSGLIMCDSLIGQVHDGSTSPDQLSPPSSPPVLPLKSHASRGCVGGGGEQFLHTDPGRSSRHAPCFDVRVQALVHVTTSVLYRSCFFQSQRRFSPRLPTGSRVRSPPSSKKEWASTFFMGLWQITTVVTPLPESPSHRNLWLRSTQSWLST